MLTVANRLEWLVRHQLGEVDAGVTDNALAAGQAAQDPAVELKGEDPFTTEYYGVATKKGSDDLVARVNKVLVDYRAGGKESAWMRSYEKWLATGLPGITAPPAQIPHRLTRGVRAAAPCTTAAYGTERADRSRPKQTEADRSRRAHRPGGESGEVIDGRRGILSRLHGEVLRTGHGPGRGRRCAGAGSGRSTRPSGTSLLALQDQAGRRLLEGAELTGVTRERWAATEQSITLLWGYFDAYAGALFEAREIRARRRHPSRDEFTALTELLRGESVTVANTGAVYPPRPRGRPGSPSGSRSRSWSGSTSCTPGHWTWSSPPAPSGGHWPPGSP
ncbi:hypothetical protein SBADM41S_04900 [Streptomyces badius]